MISELINKISQYNPLRGVHHHLQPTAENHKSTILKVYIILFLGLPTVLILMLWLFLAKVGLKIGNTTIIETYNHTGLLTFALIFLLLLSLYLLGLFMFSKWSPISVYSMRSLLLQAISEMTVLNRKADNKLLTIALEFWEFESTLYIKVFAGGHMTQDKAEKFTDLLQDFLISKTRFSNKRNLYENMTVERSTGEILVMFTPKLERIEMTGADYEF